MSDCAKLHFETFIGRWNNLSAGAFHRAFHSPGEVSYTAGPIALAEGDLIRVIGHAVIRKSLEEFFSFLLSGVLVLVRKSLSPR